LRGGGIVFGVWGCIVGDVEAGRGEEEFEWGGDRKWCCGI
jgi:hypothetical protein